MKRKPIPRGKEYITRVVCRNTSGWQVRLGLHKVKVIGKNEYKYKHKFSKLFSDSLYKGGKPDALAAAIIWRNVKWFQLPAHLRLVRVSRPNLNKYWGKGIYPVYRTRNGVKQKHWIGQYYKNKKAKKQSFSARLYGDKEAKAMAAEFREKGVINKTQRVSLAA